MTYNMIQQLLTHIIEAAALTIPALWLHYLWSSDKCLTDVRQVSERYPRGFREISESNTFGVREEFVGAVVGISTTPIQIPTEVFDSFGSESESLPLEQASNSFINPSDTSPNSVEHLKKYQLHGHEVVRVSDLGQVPKGVKRYKLRSHSVVRVKDLMAAL